MLKNEERIVKAAKYFNNVSPSQFKSEFFKQWLWFRSLINLILEHDVLTEPKPQDTTDEEWAKNTIELFTGEESQDNKTLS
jgi:hypothetical protein